MGTGTTVHVSVVPGRAIFRACRSCRHESGTTGSITDGNRGRAANCGQRRASSQQKPNAGYLPPNSDYGALRGPRCNQRCP